MGQYVESTQICMIDKVDSHLKTATQQDLRQ